MTLAPGDFGFCARSRDVVAPTIDAERAQPELEALDAGRHFHRRLNAHLARGVSAGLTFQPGLFIGVGMIAIRKQAWGITAAAAAVAIVVVAGGGGARPAFSSDGLSFAPTGFVIINPDTGIAIGECRYRVDSNGGGGTLHGESRYYDDQSDVETAQIEEHSGGEPPKLLEFDHTFFNADGSIQRRGYLDLSTGAATCIDNSGGQESVKSATLSIPPDTWAGASIIIPLQNIVRARGAGSSGSLHVFNCAPGPKIFAISVKFDPASAVWAPYGGEAIRAEIRPDFGWLTAVIKPWLPTLGAWFDPNRGFAVVGDEAARYYKGPRIMLVKTR